MDFDALKNRAKELLNEHGEQIEAAADRVGKLAKERFGHDEQIDSVVQKVKDAVPDRE